MPQRDLTHQRLWVSLLTACALASLTAPAAAQVVPDATLGTGNNSVTSIRGNRTDITGGLRRSSALFHSFEQFSILTNHQVYFANPAGIRNIFSRVTGGSISNIDGLLGVAGSANLFFMNPNGIIFGPNARLDISGSFLATTANALEFADNQKFSATGDRAVPLVAVNIPIGLQFGANPPAMLTNRGNLTTGQNLTLAAGNLDLQGQLQAGGNLTLNATDTVKIRDTVTEPFVARSGGDLTIQGNQGIDILALNHPNTTPFVSGGNFSLISDGVISGDAHYQTGGNFSILNTKGKTGDFLSIYDPIITAAGDVTFGNYTGASLQVTAGGSINTGSITINAIDPALGGNPILTLQAGVTGNPDNPAFPFPLGGTNFTTAPATTPAGITVNGNISTTLNQPFTVDLSAPGNIATKDIVAATNNNLGFSVIRLNSTGGSVILDNANLTVSNDDPTGVSGDIFIKATQNIQITNSNIESRGVFGRIFLGVVSAFGDTPAGEQVTISKSSLVATNSFSGTGGLIDINTPGSAAVPGKINITNSSLQTNSTNQSQGGEINLTTGGGGSAIDIGTSSVLDASISGQGGTGARNPGIRLNAVSGNVAIDNNSLVTTAANIGTTASALAGPINVIALNVSLDGSSSLNATTAGAAPGGNINVVATNSVNVSSSSLINTSVQSGGTGQGGSIDITTNTFSLNQGGRVQARTFDAGNAGNIQVTFNNTATIDGFDPQSLLYSGMLTDTLGSGSGGNITINTPTNLVGDLTLSNGGFLSARTTTSAPGGNIDININNLDLLTGGQVLTTSSGSGNAGSITVTAAGNVNISGSRAPLPTPTSPFDNPTFTVLSLDGLTFSTINDPLVENSNNIPYISLQRNPTGAPGRIFASQTASGSALGGTNLGATSNFDYYAFTVTRDGSRAIFDIDNAVSVPVSALDTELFLYDALTGQLLATNDDFSPANAGSTSGLDSRIARNFNSAGRYVLGVGRFPTSATNGTPITGTPLNPTDAYRLQVSLQNQGTGNFSLADRNPNQGLNSGLFAQNTANGAAGNITVNGSGTTALTLSQSAQISATTVSGISDGITLNGLRTLQVSNSSITASTETGQAGNLTVNQNGNAAGSILLSDRSSLSLAATTPGGAGTAGNIFLNTRQLTVQNNSSISASTAGSGAAGNLTVGADGGPADAITLLDSSSLVLGSTGSGNAGQVDLNSRQVSVADGSSISTSTNSGVGGNITLQNVNTLQLDNGQIAASTQTGRAGNLTVNSGESAADAIALSNNSSLSLAATAPNGAGTAGNIFLNTRQLTVQGNSSISASTAGSGNAGNLTVTANGGATNTITLLGGSSLILGSTGSGNAGQVSLNSQQITVADGSGISTSTNSGVGGNITLQNVNTLQLDNGQIAASTQTGQAGNLTVNSGESAADSITLSNGSSLSLAATTPDGAGTAGDIFLNTRQLTVQDNSSISASTAGSGEAGNLIVSANRGTADAITLLSGSSLILGSTGSGNAGNVLLDTRQLDIQDSLISASTVSGTGGGITLQGLNTLQMNNGQVIASTQTGRAGNVTANASGNIDLINGSRIAVEANGANGVAGNVTVTGRDISLIGGTNRSAISTSATGAGASAGNVTLNAAGHNLTLQGSDVIASSQQGASGNISITARRADLKNGTIKAEIGQNTAGKTGNITLDVSFRLTLEDESEISTLGQNGANGGDISILNVRFLFGKSPTGPNGSDIVGRADGGGRGGRVFLGRSTLVQGFRFGKAVPGNRTNDIDTNGQLSNFSTDADVGARGLSTPVIVFNDVSQIVGGACEAVGAKSETHSELKITGQGGVPLSPTAPLPAQGTGSDWVSLELSPQVPVGLKAPDGSMAILEPGKVYEIQATCVNGWKQQQRSLL